MRCSCTDDWPCRWHGEEGRSVALPEEIPEEWLRPYAREDESLGLWTPPKELRPAERDRDQRAQPAAVAVEPIEILRQARRNGANRFEVLWWFKDGSKHREVYNAVGWAERKVATLKEKGVWRTIWRKGHPARFQDQIVDVEVGAWYGQGDRMKTCACGCGERVLPTRSDQIYVNEQHRNRAKVRAFRARARTRL